MVTSNSQPSPHVLRVYGQHSGFLELPERQNAGILAALAFWQCQKGPLSHAFR